MLKLKLGRERRASRRFLFTSYNKVGAFFFGGSGNHPPERLYRSRRNMNQLFVGLTKQVDPPQRGLFIHDDVPDISRARIFDPTQHSFNPLKDIDYRKARALAEVLYTAYPQGDSTLTVRNGKRALLKALLSATRLDKIEGDPEVEGMIDDLLQSPVLKRVLCNTTNQFSFNPNSLILARINRAELGDFDALILGLFLIGHFKGQVVVPDGGFYLRDTHLSLIREERLIAGVNFLSELTPKLRNSVLLIEDKIASGTTLDDAGTLADYARVPRGTNAFNSFVDQAMY
jgi:hypothetical protein